MLFSRFSRCLNEMYLLDNIKFYTTGSETPTEVNPNDVANEAFVQDKYQVNPQTGKVKIVGLGAGVDAKKAIDDATGK